MSEEKKAICQNCTYWSIHMAGQFGHHECINPLVGGTGHAHFHALSTRNFAQIATGPFFGCIHFSKEG